MSGDGGRTSAELGCVVWLLTIGLREKEAVNVFFYCELGAIAGSFASGTAPHTCSPAY